MTSMTSKKRFKTRNYKLRREAAILELEQRGQKRVCFGNEMEKLEEEVIKNCRLLRVRADRRALRRKVRSDISIGSRNAYTVVISKTIIQERIPNLVRYKNGVPIDLRLAPAGKYKIKNKFGMLTLRISRCSMKDSAEYSVVIENQYGKAYSFATVLVRKYYGKESGFDSEIYRSELLKNSERQELKYQDREASLRVPCAYKEDEGFYTIRVPSLGGCKEQTTYVFVQDAAAESAGAPGSPLNVKCHDINKDCLILSWIAPSDCGGSPILGYFIERCTAGSENWVPCNEKPTKTCRYPVLGLAEGQAYQFRVKAVNKAGISHPSKTSDPVIMYDPSKGKRVTALYLLLDNTVLFDITVIPYDEGRMIEIFKDDLEGKPYSFRVRSVNKYGISEPSLPSEPITAGAKLAPLPPPSQVLAFRDTKTSVVLQWDKLKDGLEPLGYYIYCRESGTEEWQTVNNKPVMCHEFTVPGLKPGKEYVFCVKSVSEAGLSESSPETDPIIVRPAIVGTRAITWDKVLSSISSSPELSSHSHKITSMQGHTNNFSAFLNPKVSNLEEGHLYEFRACAMNMAGVGEVSEPSNLFKCEEWTMPEPGPPYDVKCAEVRDSSLMLHWQAPLYIGAGPITGYYVDMCEEGTEEWKQINKQSTATTHMKVSDLDTGKCFIFRVRALNKAGIGPPSLPSDPVVAKSKPGTNEIELGVDEEGFIYMAFEAPEKNDSSEFIWSKDYEGPPDADRVWTEEKGNKSKLILKDPSEKDLGIYSVEVTDVDDDISASCTLTQEDLDKLLKRSHEIRNPLIKLISGWNVDVLEKGEVRLWLEVEKLSPNAELHLIFNEKELTSTPTHKINFVKGKGLVELIIQNFCDDDKGVYTAQLQDGKAKNQFTLVLLDESFDTVAKEADAKRREWKKKQGPYFVENLKWKVTENCEVLLTCKGLGMNNAHSNGYSQTNEGLLIIPSALSATPLKIQPTDEGIKIYTDVKYYTDYMKTTWFHKEKRLEIRDKLKAGSTMNQIWLHILNPTDTDKGKYILELFDGNDSHKLSTDLSGQVFEDALAEHRRLKEAAIAEKCRARVVQGLPDVATIMEDKTLCLTCCISGDPYPEITWFKNEKTIIFKDRYRMDVKGTVITITIEKVCNEDTGKYSIYVKNKYGSETGQVTVSVYKRGEIPIGVEEKEVPTLPEDLIKMARDIKPIVEIQQKGDDFVVTSKTPRQTVTNSFTLGKEADITTMDGKKLKCTVHLANGKLVCKSEKFSHEQEVKGNEMVE
ncbi:hypothetical protein CIB84_000771, partial [Bambusicola thoracicus]